MIVEWSPGFSSGISRIDEENKKLFDIVNVLHECYKNASPAETVLEVVDEMADYAIRHFAGEEKSMLFHHYPDIREHLAQHCSFKVMVHDLRNSLLEGATPDYYSTFLFLFEWLSAHIGKMDKEYFDYLLNQEFFDFVNRQNEFAAA